MSVQLGESAILENGDFKDGGSPGRKDLFSKESSENVPVKEERVIKKARRTMRRSSSGEDGAVNGTGGPNGYINKAQFSKNSRKSRTGYGRGEPKKGTIFLNFLLLP